MVPVAVVVGSEPDDVRTEILFIRITQHDDRRSVRQLSDLGNTLARLGTDATHIQQDGIESPLEQCPFHRGQACFAVDQEAHLTIGVLPAFQEVSVSGVVADLQHAQTSVVSTEQLLCIFQRSSDRDALPQKASASFHGDENASTKQFNVQVRRDETILCARHDRSNAEDFLVSIGQRHNRSRARALALREGCQRDIARQRDVHEYRVEVLFIQACSSRFQVIDKGQAAVFALAASEVRPQQGGVAGDLFEV